MVAVERYFTKTTDKTAAGRTGNHGFFPGMVKTSGLFIHLQRIAGSTGWKFPIEGRKNIRP